MILQFGAGNFLRAFVDLFVSETRFDQIVVVQSTGRERCDVLNRAGGRYHVAIQGIADGVVVNETRQVTSIREALHSGTDWEKVCGQACSPELRWIVSNTTEAGFALDDRDVDPKTEGPPHSFPAKLLRLLWLRHGSGLPGPDLLPCELIDQNATRLRDLVWTQAGRWGLLGSAGFADWLRNDCRWVSSLVDRIVPGPPRNHPLTGEDPLLLSAEPFALWAIASTEPFALLHPAVVTAPDIAPFALRKIRILNGLHSALVCRALPMGIETVRQAMEQAEVCRWLESLLFEEIVPVLEGRVEDPEGFGRAVLDRFRNPFLEHRLTSIALHHETKLQVRLRPTCDEYRQKFGRAPRLLSALV